MSPIYEYFLVFLIRAEISWSYMLLPLDNYRQIPQPLRPSSQNVGEPLILTPYLKSNRISKARNLSSVDSLIEGENIVSNSGFFTVDGEYNSNLFFWFFRQNSSNWTEAPLILWLQGGPGCSSLFGLFEENGPFTVTNDGMKTRNYSWTNNYNVLYIDQPVGSGFSFTKSSGYINTQEAVANHLYKALTQFFQLYPELRGNPFYIAGESYAGKYIPAISYKIHTLKKTNLTDVNLKGLFMISAFTQGLHNGFANFCYAIGLIDSRNRTRLNATEGLLELSIKDGEWRLASKFIDFLINTVDEVSHVSNYDFTKSVKNVEEYPYSSIINEDDMRQKIHVGNVEYNICNYQVLHDFREDIPKSVVSWIEELVNHYPVAFVGGQFDVIVAYPLVLNVMENLNWSGASEYKSAVREIINEAELDGYIKSAGNLKDILIRNAGHNVPRDQPRATYEILDKFVKGEL